MKRYKSFTLIEMLVVIFILGLLTATVLPNYTKYRQQSELERTAQQIQNAVYEIRSLAVAPNMIKSNGKMMNNYILVLNITTQNQNYCDAQVIKPSPPWPPGSVWDCSVADPYIVPPNSYTIFATDDISPLYARTEYKTVRYDPNISIYYDYPCRGIVAGGCPTIGGSESHFWKPHFRNKDGMIGFNGYYFDNPDWVGLTHTSYWIVELWGCNSYSDCSSKQRLISKVVFVWGNIGDTTQIVDTSRCNVTTHRYTDPLSGRQFECKALEIDNITGKMEIK